MQNNCIACKQKPADAVCGGGIVNNDMCRLCRLLVETALEYAGKKTDHLSNQARKRIIEGFCSLKFEYEYGGTGQYYTKETHERIMRFINTGEVWAASEYEDRMRAIERNERERNRRQPYDVSSNDWSSTAPETISEQ